MKGRSVFSENLPNSVNHISFYLQLCEGLLGLAEVYYLKEDMKEAKKLLLRSRELATHVLGPKHHYVAAIISKVCHLPGLGISDGFFTPPSHKVEFTMSVVQPGSMVPKSKLKSLPVKGLRRAWTWVGIRVVTQGPGCVYVHLGPFWFILKHRSKSSLGSQSVRGLWVSGWQLDWYMRN